MHDTCYFLKLKNAQIVVSGLEMSPKNNVKRRQLAGNSHLAWHCTRLATKSRHNHIDVCCIHARLFSISHKYNTLKLLTPK